MELPFYLQVLLAVLKLLAILSALLLITFALYLRHQWLERRAMREMEGEVKRSLTRASAHTQTTEYRNSSMGRR